MYQGKQDPRARPSGVQLPPIDRKKSNMRQNAQVEKQTKQQQQSQQPSQNEDKYEQMRNRSKNNADRLQKLKDIKSQYTIKKGKKGDKLSKVKSEGDQNFHQGNDGAGQNYENDGYDRRDDDENVMDLINNYNKNNGKGGDPTEREIEDLERELAQLKSDIQNQESHIADLDDLQRKSSTAGNPQSEKQQKQQQQQPDYKNMVFGQRVKGKDMNDYWNNADQKTTYKVQQNPGGQSQVHIGDDYNFFKDKENANYKQSKNGKNFYSPKNAQKNGYGQNSQEESIYNGQQRQNSDMNHSQLSSSKKHHPNEQQYNIINHSNFIEEKSDRDRNPYSNKQPPLPPNKQNYNNNQNQNYNSNQNQNQNYNSNNQNPNKNQQSINIFEGYPNQTNTNAINKQKNSNPFISSLYYQQEKEQQQQQPSNSYARGQQSNNQQQPSNQPPVYNQQYNQQQTDITADGKKNVRVTQPPGGRSQIVFC